MLLALSLNLSLDQPDFLHFEQDFHVFLFATLVLEEEIGKYENFFLDFELYWIPAIRKYHYS